MKWDGDGKQCIIQKSHSFAVPNADDTHPLFYDCVCECECVCVKLLSLHCNFCVSVARTSAFFFFALCSPSVTCTCNSRFNLFHPIGLGAREPSTFCFSPFPFSLSPYLSPAVFPFSLSYRWPMITQRNKFWDSSAMCSYFTLVVLQRTPR